MKDDTKKESFFVSGLAGLIIWFFALCLPKVWDQESGPMHQKMFAKEKQKAENGKTSGVFGDGSQDEMFEGFLKIGGYLCIVSIVIAIIIAIAYFEIPLFLPLG